jgi:hypothetical protein
MICNLLFCFFTFYLLLFPFSAFSLDDKAKGLEIAMEASRRNQGYGDYTAEVTMILKNAHGEESIRKLRASYLDVADDGDKSLLIFDEPADIKGTALLTHAHKEGPDDQFLYMPSLRRVKRISSKNKSGPFVGSEFAFEDVAPVVIEKKTYKYLRDEVYEGKDCFVYERYPKDPYTGYTRQVVWRDKDEYRYWRIDFYDRRNELLKTAKVNKYQIYEGKFWQADDEIMVNHQTGKSTQIIWSNYHYRTGLTDRDFSSNTLKRIR